MNFDVNRLSKLAGLATPGARRSLTEGADVEAAEEEEEIEEAAELEAEEGYGHDMMEDETEEGYGHDMMEDKHADQLPPDDADANEDDMVEIDLNRLREETQAMRQRRVDERKFRSIVRNEIASMVQEMDAKGQTASWLYGDNPPQNSKSGSVSRGFFGIGFKND